MLHIGSIMKPPLSSFAPVLALACCLAGGCASAPLPRDFEPSRARIVTAMAVPKLDVSGLPGGKPGGAGVGAGTGGGVGVVAGAAACVAAGPLFGVCLATVLPAATAIGAVTGGVVGAARTESSEAMALKTKALADELAATPYRERLSHQLEQQSGIAAEPGSVDVKPWALEVGVIEVGTEGNSEFAVRLVTRVQLRQDSAAPIWQATKEVQSETVLTTSQWLAKDSKALRSVLDRCIEQAAHQLAAELARSRTDVAVAASPRVKYSSSCEDEPLQDRRIEEARG